LVVAGSSVSVRGKEAFRWSAAEGMIGLGDLPSGMTVSEAFGISADGEVVVGQATCGATNTAFRWTAAEGLRAVGGYGEGMKSRASAVSADGQVITGDMSSDTGEEAFIWTGKRNATGLVPLRDRIYNYPAAISADASVIVGRMYSDGVADEAFIWRPANGIQNLQSTLLSAGLDTRTWRFSTATGVSADGQVIVGYGFKASGETEAWMLNLKGVWPLQP
jgi:uncharacterized membrane protein